MADVVTVQVNNTVTGTVTQVQTVDVGYSLPSYPSMPLLTRTTVQTSNYTASTNQIVPVDTTSGPVTITLPNAPGSGTLAAVKMVTQGAANTVTVACAGTDVFNKSGGPASGTLTLLNQGMLVEYNAGIWTVLADDLPLSQLDARYGGQSLLTTLGDTMYEGSSGLARLPGNTTTIRKFWRQQGNGTVSAAPAWDTLQSGDLPAVPGSLVGLAPVGTQAAGGDAANINGLINLGGKAVLQAGQFWLEAPIVPVQDKYTRIDGAGDGVTILSPANGANCDVIQGQNFSSLTGTGTGSATGAGPFLQISNLTIDGNAANQTLPALTNASCNPATAPANGYGIRLYGRNWKIANVDVRNCAAYGMWTEWGITSGSSTNLSGSVAGRAVNVQVYENGAHGWYHRGPSDCQLVNVLAFENNVANLNAALDFWAEGDGVTNGSGTNHFTPNGIQLVNCHFWGGQAKWNLVLDCTASAANCHAEGAQTGNALFRGNVKWTGGSPYYIAGQAQATGCGVQFGDAGSTAGVPTTALFTSNVAFFGVITGVLADVGARAGIVWASCNQSQVEALILTKTVPTGSVAAGSNGQTLPQATIFFTNGATLPPNGTVSIADTGGPDTVTYTGNTGSTLTGCAGGTHALATGQTITLQNVGTVAISGAVDTASTVAIEVNGSGLASGVTEASSLHYAKGKHRLDIGSGNLQYSLTNAGTDAFYVNTSSKNFGGANGYTFRLYSDAYSTITASVNGATGAVQPGTTAGAGGHIYSGSGAPNITGSVAGDLYLRTDTPSTANQRLYIATAANTWTALSV